MFNSFIYNTTIARVIVIIRDLFRYSLTSFWFLFAWHNFYNMKVSINIFRFRISVFGFWFSLCSDRTYDACLMTTIIMQGALCSVYILE